MSPLILGNSPLAVNKGNVQNLVWLASQNSATADPQHILGLDSPFLQGKLAYLEQGITNLKGVSAR